MPNEDCTKYELGQATTDYDPVSRKTVAYIIRTKLLQTIQTNINKVPYEYN